MRHLEKQKDDFIGIVSHELKNPLTSIKAFSQLLENYLDQNKDEKGTFYLSKMAVQIERLTELMASFTDVYQIQNGKLALKKKSFKLDELIANTVVDFHYATKSHTIEHSVPNDLIVFADKERISSVLVNLISNAIKYSPMSKKVLVSATVDDDQVTITVQDFGFGISKVERIRIFERFFRVRSKKEKNIPGLGLGLYISHEIITQHKGKIWVDSIEGQGSTFNVQLPRSKKEKVL